MCDTPAQKAFQKPPEDTHKAPKDTKYRSVFYTYNNPSKKGPDWHEYVRERLPVSYHVHQLEEGDIKHTPHLQGYIEFRQQVRKSQIVGALSTKFWFQPRFGTAIEAYEYATKTGKWAHEVHQRKDGPWEEGVRSKQGYRTDIEDAVHTYIEDGPKCAAQRHTQTMVINGRGIERVAHMMFEPYRREVNLIILYGQGGTGKTELFERSEGLDQVHRFPTTSNLKWIGAYTGQPFLQIDEFKGVKHMPDPSYLHTILDKRTLEFEVKGGYVWGVWHTVIITTNTHPRKWFQWEKTEEWEPFVRRITEFRVWHKDGVEGFRDPDITYKKGTEAYVKEFEY